MRAAFIKSCFAEHQPVQFIREMMESPIVTKRFRSNRNDAGSLLASTFIVALGAGSCLFAMMALSPAKTPSITVICGVASGALLLFIVRQRFRIIGRRRMSFLSLLSRTYRDDGLACQYEPRKVIHRRQHLPSQVNQPISIDELREIQSSSANTWVPTKARYSEKAS